MKPRFRPNPPPPGNRAAPASAGPAPLARAVALHQGGRLDEALALYRQILRLEPKHFDALHLSGVIACQTGDPARAVALIGQALALRTDHAEAHSNLANAQRELGRFEDAVASCERAIALRPDLAAAYSNRGNALRDLRRLDAALQSFDTAVALAPALADSHMNRANVLQDLQHAEAARQALETAIALQPHHAGAHSNLGNTLRILRYLDASLAHLDAAIALQPSLAEAHRNRGDTLRELKRFDDALQSYATARALQPSWDFLDGIWLQTKMSICDWTGFDAELARLAHGIARGEKLSSPFTLLALIDSPALQRDAARTWAADRHPARRPSPPPVARAPDRKIRIGYYSADFHDHATAYLTAQLFEEHDKARFEIVAFSFGPIRDDAMRRRLVAAFDGFVEVGERSDAEVAQISRELGIDIAVDLKGYTQDSRAGIFMERAAPLQVSWLGYPGTMAAGFIDYFVADPVALAPAARPHFSEKIVDLPDSYQVNDARRSIAGRVPGRAELGLPEAGFVYCCFNNSYKITPPTFAGWMRILGQVEGSVLWLLADNDSAVRNLKVAAAGHGIDPARLVFAPRVPLEDHLARHRAADLFLDTLPCNAHTTASDALWAGLPVLTCAGAAFASRVAASLLHAVGCADLVTDTPAAFEARAVELARRPAALAAIRERLAASRGAAPLFDARRFARHLEAAFVQMDARQRAGLEPEDITVAPVAAPTPSANPVSP
jgi:protein O-GlcNAc transferase